MFGTLIASVVGTTGAAMILIRPLVRANAARLHNVHVVVFFIFLVGNIGGALSPLGDPPLFIGFLNGIDFFWPLRHLWQPTVFAAVWVLALFVAMDVWFYFRDRRAAPVGEAPAAREPLRVHGVVNLLLLALIIAAVVNSALWQPGISFTVYGTDAAAAGSGARRAPDRRRARLAVAHAQSAARRQRLFVRADPRSRVFVCRHLRLRRAGAGHARCRP